MIVKRLQQNGEVLANQFVILDDRGNRYLRSYDSVITKIDSDGLVSLDAAYWDYSKTTARARCIFLGEKKKETLKKITSKEYKLTNLND